MRGLIPIFFLWAGAGVALVHSQHESDIHVGQNSGMRLEATNLPARTIFLSPVSSGQFRGWSSTFLGFDEITAANEANSLHSLSAGANIFIEIVTADLGLSLRSFTAPASVFAEKPGDRLRIGTAGNLHNHPILFIDSSVVGANFTSRRLVRFRLVDLGAAGLFPSPDYFITLSPVLPANLGIARSAEGVTLSFATFEGLAYQIESTASPFREWANAGSVITGTRNTAQFVTNAASINQFFRVRSFPDN